MPIFLNFGRVHSDVLYGIVTHKYIDKTFQLLKLRSAVEFVEAKAPKAFDGSDVLLPLAVAALDSYVTSHALYPAVQYLVDKYVSALRQNLESSQTKILCTIPLGVVVEDVGIERFNHLRDMFLLDKIELRSTVVDEKFVVEAKDAEAKNSGGCPCSS